MGNRKDLPIRIRDQDDYENIIANNTFWIRGDYNTVSIYTGCNSNKTHYYARAHKKIFTRTLRETLLLGFLRGHEVQFSENVDL